VGLDTVELVIEAEKLFDISIPDELAALTETVGQFVGLIYDLRVQIGKPVEKDEILLQLQHMISKSFAIPIERIVPEASFTKDLRLD
jgi:acyl carrier protein